MKGRYIGYISFNLFQIITNLKKLFGVHLELLRFMRRSSEAKVKDLEVGFINIINNN